MSKIKTPFNLKAIKKAANQLLSINSQFVKINALYCIGDDKEYYYTKCIKINKLNVNSIELTTDTESDKCGYYTIWMCDGDSYITRDNIDN